jgi:hypothetical protein
MVLELFIYDDYFGGDLSRGKLKIPSYLNFFPTI